MVRRAEVASRGRRGAFAYVTSAAREIGTFSLKTKGPKQEVTGKYVVVWEKVGTDWQLATDIWNDGK
jgi:ketosteroid isomerase-like protein